MNADPRSLAGYVFRSREIHIAAKGERLVPGIVQATANHCRRIVANLITRALVDAEWPHRWWRCHRLPSRSFILAGRQLHLCARCTGIVIGAGLMGTGFLLPVGSRYVVALVAVVLLASDGLTQMMGFRASTNATRFCTGLLFGAAVPAAAVTFLYEVLAK